MSSEHNYKTLLAMMDNFAHGYRNSYQGKCYHVDFQASNCIFSIFSMSHDLGKVGPIFIACDAMAVAALDKSEKIRVNLFCGVVDPQKSIVSDVDLQWLYESIQTEKFKKLALLKYGKDHETILNISIEALDRYMTQLSRIKEGTSNYNTVIDINKEIERAVGHRYRE